MGMLSYRIALAQMETRLGDVKGNAEKVLAAIERAKKEKVDLLITPEMALLGFGAGDIYLDKVRENEKALFSMLNKIKRVDAVIGFVHRDALGFYHNAAALVCNASIAGLYYKYQLVNYRLFDEKRYFKPGNTLPVFWSTLGRIGMLICEDIWFPEPARVMALRAADLLVCLSASPYERGKEEIWEQYLRVRAMDNILPIAFCNQAGCQDGVTYWGGSMVINAEGQVLARGKFLQEDFVIAELPITDAYRTRRRDIRLRELRREVFQTLLNAYDDRESTQEEIEKKLGRKKERRKK